MLPKFAVWQLKWKNVVNKSNALHKTTTLTVLPQHHTYHLFPKINWMCNRIGFFMLLYSFCYLCKHQTQIRHSNTSSLFVSHEQWLIAWLYGVLHGCHWYLGSSFSNSQEEEGSRAERAVRWTLPSMLGAAECCTLEGAARCGWEIRGSSPS